jgi:hypothetical protein
VPKQKPDALALIIWEIATLIAFLVLMPSTIGFGFDLAVVLAGISFSTWAVLPWAFLESLQKKTDHKAIKWLRDGQIYFFSAGSFYALYLLMYSSAVDISSFNSLVYFMLLDGRKFIIVWAIALTLFGLIQSACAVNRYSDIGPEHRKLISYTFIYPFLILDAVIVAVLVKLFFEINLFYFEIDAYALIVMLLITAAWTVGYGDDLVSLVYEPRKRGFILLCFYLLPLVILFILYSIKLIVVT